MPDIVDPGRAEIASGLQLARYAFTLLSVLWLAASLKVRRPAWLLLGVVGANAWVWAETNLPLQQIYGLPASRDRVGNLALCQVVAAGNSPLRTAQLGQLHFEPFWSLFTAAASGFDPERLLWLYPFFSLMMAGGFALSLYAGLRAPGSNEAWSGWERALVAGFATLLASTPFEHAGIYRQPWAMTFLLKPNHALGFVLFPVVLAVFVRARSWRGRLASGLTLHLLGWVFVLHMVYVSAGLVAYAAMSWFLAPGERRRDMADVAVTIGVNAAVVSPYIVMLFLGYPFLDRSPRMTIAETSPHLLEVSARVAPMFALAAWGGVVAARRADRLGRAWAAQLLSALALWVVYLGLGALQIARERDEIYYWVRFLTAASAAIGVWDLAGRAAAAASGLADVARRATIIALVGLPFSLPYWWDPLRMDPYFGPGLAPMADRLRIPTDYLRRHTPRDAVILSDGDFARYAAAFGARRVLVADTFHQPIGVVERMEAQNAVLTDPEGKSRAALAAYGRKHSATAWYAAVTPQWLASLPEPRSLDEVRQLAHLEPVHFWGDEAGDFVALFRVRLQ